MSVTEMPMRRFVYVLAVLLQARQVLAADRPVPIRAEPPQPLKAIALRAGDTILPVAVKDGSALVPEDLPLPWVVSLTRFEATTYTAADAAQHRPLIVRELGHLRGTVSRPQPPPSERFLLLLRRSSTNAVDELPFTVRQDGAFDLALPADVYDAAAIGESSATRIRSAVVVHAGAVTDVGTLRGEPATRAAFRVVDARGRTPLRGATVTWDPPSTVLNANVAKVLYAHRWSGLTDANGAVTFPALGPLPLPIRWRIDAPGYATSWSPVADLHEVGRGALPDVALRLRALVLVRVRLPRDVGELRHAALVLGDPLEENPSHFKEAVRAPLREGDLAFTANTYGRKRLWVESSAGAPLLYRDIYVDREQTVIDLAPTPVLIHGTVARRGKPLERALVRAADPVNAQTILALARTDADGQYRFTTWQSGSLFLYAIPETVRGSQSFAVDQRINLDGAADVRADFDLPEAGVRLTVIDVTTGAPLHAAIDKRLRFANGHEAMGMAQTDGDGHLVLDGFPEGTLHASVRAPGHYSKTIDAALTPEIKEIVVGLEKSGTIVGRVLGADGAPVGGARISGGYPDEVTAQAFFETTSDESGRFTFDSAAAPGTLFYVAAPRYALGITTLEPDRENLVRLTPPGRGGAVLMPDNAPPTQAQLVMAAPAGGDYIPMGALYELAQLNGLNAFQLQGAGRDGSVALPRFLPPGSYTFYVAEPGSSPLRYQRVGNATLPANGPVVFAYRSK